MIEVSQLTKRFGPKLAVDQLSFVVQPGLVTGLLGPNGAGKSTTMRLVLGLDHATEGTATVLGRPYPALESPMHEVGAVLDATSVDGTRTARQHLRWLARAGAVSSPRVDEVLAMVGLVPAADQRIKGFSLGMLQRLGIASALLGDPRVLLLDEPMNGLDPEGIRWVRTLLRALADEGRTVLVSSHLMSEVEAMADHVLVMGRGRLVADAPTAELLARGPAAATRVVSPHHDALQQALVQAGAEVVDADDGAMHVTGIDNVGVAELAAEADLRIHELTPLRSNLETVFMELTGESVEHRSTEVASR